MDERVKFIGRYLSGEKIAPLCREFGISRKTGHKIIERYKDTGWLGDAPVACIIAYPSVN